VGCQETVRILRLATKEQLALHANLSCQPRYVVDPRHFVIVAAVHILYPILLSSSLARYLRGYPGDATALPPRTSSMSRRHENPGGPHRLAVHR
jgi:hypothetical protein